VPLLRLIVFSAATLVAMAARVDDPPFTALAIAARTGDLGRMSALLDAGADPNRRDPGGNRWVALMHAVHKHQLAAASLLLDRGALPDGPAGLRLTPLMMAVGSGQTDLARLLIDRGANLRRPTPSGATLLTLAVSGGALTDIDEPLLGACHADTVRLIRMRAPDMTVDHSWRGRVALFFSWLNGCSDVQVAVERGH
jgi:ankyrin repeat protein